MNGTIIELQGGEGDTAVDRISLLLKRGHRISPRGLLCHVEESSIIEQGKTKKAKTVKAQKAER